MTKDELSPFTDACVALVGNVAANSVLADYIVAALASSSGGGSGSSQGVRGATGGLPALVAAIQKEDGITQQARLRNVIFGAAIVMEANVSASH